MPQREKGTKTVVAAMRGVFQPYDSQIVVVLVLKIGVDIAIGLAMAILAATGVFWSVFKWIMDVPSRKFQFTS